MTATAFKPNLNVEYKFVLKGALSARFDRAALQPFAWSPEPASARPAWPDLRAWCLAGWLDAPLAVAFHECGDRALARVSALALELDGSVLLHQSRSGLDRALLRARTKWQDLRPGPHHPATAIWDSGFVPHQGQALTALARFEPRRPTFIVLQDFGAAELGRALSSLRARSKDFRCPVRILILGDPPPPESCFYIPA